MRSRFTYIIFILFYTCLAYSNNTVITDSYKSSYRFPFIKSATTDEQRTNYVIQQISYDNSISFSDVHLKLGYVLNVELNRLRNQRSEFKLNLSISAVSGDTRIQEMDVSTHLSPTICTFEYILFNKQSAKVYRQEMLYQELKNGSLNIQHIIPGYLDKDEFGLEFYGLKFYYSKLDVIRLKSFISLIEDYYASARLADSLLLQAAKWRPDNEKDLLFNYFKISEFKRICSIIEDKKFEESLNLKKQDPADLLTKINSLSTTKRRLQTLLNEGVKSSRLYFPNEIILAQQIVDCQRQYEGFLEGADFNNTRFLDELSQINYSNVWFTNIHSFFIKGLSRRQQAQVNEYFERFVKALRNEHRAVAEQMLQSKKFAQANIHIENAKHLRKSLTDKDKKLLTDLQSKAVYGLYNSYLSIAHRALSVPNVDLARQYLGKALTYQKKNKRFISRDDAIYKAYHQLIRELIAKAVILKKDQEFPEATSLLLEAVDICRSVRMSDLKQDIETELHDIYKLESFQIMKLNDKRLFTTDSEEEELVQNELIRLKGSQQVILNQLQRLNEE